MGSQLTSVSTRLSAANPNDNGGKADVLQRLSPLPPVEAAEISEWIVF
jgi:hypothetical protein